MQARIQVRENLVMLTVFYIEALLSNKVRADHVWEQWAAGDIDDETAVVSWWWIFETSGRLALCQTSPMLYSESETAWLNRRAENISKELGWPLPIARSEACAELVRMRTRESAVVLQFRPRTPTAERPTGRRFP